MIKAVIFDLDGVIVDTAKYHYLAWKELANNLGFDISIEQNEYLKGLSRTKSLDLILEWGKIELTQDQKDRFLIQKNTAYLKYVETLDKTDILSGIETVLKYLKEHNIAVALGSASKNVIFILEKLKIKHMFDAIVDGTNVKRAKPNPEVFLKAAKQLHINPKECIVIEDAKAGVTAAKNAEMLCIGIGDKTILKEANYIFDDTSKLSLEFLDILLKN